MKDIIFILVILLLAALFGMFMSFWEIDKLDNENKELKDRNSLLKSRYDYIEKITDEILETNKEDKQREDLEIIGLLRLLSKSERYGCKIFKSILDENLEGSINYFYIYLMIFQSGEEVAYKWKIDAKYEYLFKKVKEFDYQFCNTTNDPKKIIKMN